MSPRRLASVAIVLALAASGCSRDGDDDSSDRPEPAAAEATTTTAPRDLEPPDTSLALLFVARSHTGTLDTADDGTVTLTLEDTDTMTWFSDRPDHDAGVSSARDALEVFGWADDGDDLDEPPNSALIAEEFGDETPIVELLHASLANGNITFEVIFVGDPPAVTGELTHVDLFIDSVAPRLTGIAEHTFPILVPIEANAVVGPDGTMYTINSYAVPGTTIMRGDRVTFEPGPRAWTARYATSYNVALA